VMTEASYYNTSRIHSAFKMPPHSFYEKETATKAA